MSTMPLARSASASAAASTVVVEVDRADDQRALGRVGDERGRELAAPRPSRRGAPRSPTVRRTHQSRPPLAEHPLDLVGEQDQGRQRGRVVGLLLARVVERRLQREEFRLPAVAGAVELLDPGDRGGAEQRQPEAAVGGEALLRGEVVDVGLADVDRQAAGARGGVDQDQRVAGVGGALDRDHDAGRGLVVGPGDHVGGGVGARRRARRRARPRPRSGRRGRAPRRSTWRTSARTRRR